VGERINPNFYFERPSSRFLFPWEIRSQRENMTMPDLPPDLVEEILSRVPATSVKKLRSTCTQWNAIFKDERFTEKHFSKAPKESMVLMLKEHRVCPVKVNLNK